nr:ribonuclease H-like domain-containing protein [Tanacetum cinerariifolium]
NAGQAEKKTVPDQEYILLPLWTSNPLLSPCPKNTEDNAGKKVTEVLEKQSRVSSKKDDKHDQDLRDEFKRLIQQKKNGENDVNSTNNINTVSLTVNTASIKDNVVDKNIVYGCKFDGKDDEGFFVGYSVNSKTFRVFNSRTRIVEETLHITFLENKPNVA